MSVLTVVATASLPGQFLASVFGMYVGPLLLTHQLRCLLAC